MRNKPTAANPRPKAGNRWSEIWRAQWHKVQITGLVIVILINSEVSEIRNSIKPFKSIWLEFLLVNLMAQMGLGRLGRSKHRLLSRILSTRRRHCAWICHWLRQRLRFPARQTESQPDSGLQACQSASLPVPPPFLSLTLICLDSLCKF